MGFEFRETGINDSTKGIASVHVARPLTSNMNPLISHDTDILFSFVMEGGMKLSAQGHHPINLKPGDAFVIPPDFKYQMTDFTNDLEILEVSLPGNFKTLTW